MSAHLTNEELTDKLLGVSSLTVNAHLMNCPVCTGELERMKRSISEFRGAAQAWSESQQRTANTFSVVHAAPKSPRGLGSWGFGNWMLAAAAMIVFAAGLTVLYARPSKSRAGNSGSCGDAREGGCICPVAD